MMPVQAESCRHQQTCGERIQGTAGNAQGKFFESIGTCLGKGSNSAYHMPDSDAGNDFHQGIDAKAEKGQRPVGTSEPDGDHSFGQVVEDGDDGQQVRGGIVAIVR